MAEHVCEYEWDEDVDGIRFLYCHTGCTDTVFPDEIKTRVNATERLSAEDAKVLLGDYPETYTENIQAVNSLRAYADALAR